MFLLPILIPSCNSSGPAFLMMCSEYRLNKQGDKQTVMLYPFLNNEPIRGRSQDGGGIGRVITFSSTNSLKEQQNGEQSLQNNF